MVRDDVRRVTASVGGDIAIGLRHLVVNSLGGAVLTPRAARYAIYRLVGRHWGLDVQATNVWPGCVFTHRCNVTIGRGTFVNSNCLFEGGAITIGTDCHIGMGAAFITAEHIIDEDGKVSPASVHRDIVVGDRVWIGARALVLAGVTIRDDITVGAGAVVAKDLTEHGVYAGVPARLVRAFSSGPGSPP
jgi:maltose O-acetyltransferase